MSDNIAELTARIEGLERRDEAATRQRFENAGEFARLNNRIAELEVEKRRAATEMLDSIRGSLIGYPNCGGDVVVMREVERIAKEHARPLLEALKAAVLIIGPPEDVMSKYFEQVIAKAEGRE